MRGRGGLLGALPWVLCACAVTMLCLTAVLTLVAGSDATGPATWVPVVEALAFVSIPLVGAVIAARLPANPYGWVCCALGCVYGVLALSAALSGSGAGGWPVEAAAKLAYPALAGLLVFVFLLFPTGRLPSPRWRWLSRTSVLLGVLLAAATPFAPSMISPDTPAPWTPAWADGPVLGNLVTTGTFALFSLVLVAMASVVWRFRRAGPVERQQLKWFVLAAAVNAVYFLLDLSGITAMADAWIIAQVIAVSVIPLAVGIAVLKYRLYEIDRIISRSVSYGLLTGALAASYLALVTVLGPLLEPLTGGSALAVAGSTLAVAAMFDPARRRLQTLVDRRFDRARYDAARAVDAFAARLRSEVDLDQVSAGLRDTVVTTVAPTRVAVWLRDVAPAREV